MNQDYTPKESKSMEGGPWLKVTPIEESAHLQYTTNVLVTISFWVFGSSTLMHDRVCFKCVYLVDAHEVIGLCFVSSLIVVTYSG